MSNEEDLAFAEEILRIRPKTCTNCWFNRKGHCALYSCECTTAVGNRATSPPRWASYKEGEEMESRVPNFRAKKQ